MDLPPERRYSITINTPDGARNRLGRYMLRFTGAHGQAETRQGAVVAELELVSSARSSSVWTLTAADGTAWELGGCGCSG